MPAAAAAVESDDVAVAAAAVVREAALAVKKFDDERTCHHPEAAVRTCDAAYHYRCLLAEVREVEPDDEGCGDGVAWCTSCGEALRSYHHHHCDGEMPDDWLSQTAVDERTG